VANPLKRVHLHVSGRVQGVFYRAECATRARELGLAGFVRNLPDGRVEAAFEGPAEAVDKMVRWCRQGTDWSEVADIEVTEEEAAGEKDFRVAR
jgi:acylphosphatase